jgi:hypothetical protein
VVAVRLGEDLTVPSNVLPPAWTVTTAVEQTPLPQVCIGSADTYGTFARQTTYVRNSIGQLVASSGDRDDAINQALAVAQATEQPYDSTTWSHP